MANNNFGKCKKCLKENTRLALLDKEMKDGLVVKYDYSCGVCFSCYYKEKYHSNLQYRRNNNIANSKIYLMEKEKYLDYLGGKKCSICGVENLPIVCYDFHHEGKKSFYPLSNKARKLSWDSIKIELDKCVVLCANCHRIKHAVNCKELNK